MIRHAATALLAVAGAFAAPATADAAEFPVYLDGAKLTQSVTGADGQGAADGERSVFYQIAYPKDWRDRGLAPPICDPCDHAGDGVTWTDHHDHLMTRPDLAHRHVFNIEPAYGEDAALNEAVAAAYAAHLPVTSAVAANRLIAARLDGGAPVARLVDYGFYFDATLVDE